MIPAPTFVHDGSEQAARERSLLLRDELLARNWPTSLQLGRLIGCPAANAAQYAAQKRAEAKLFGVWSLKDRAFVHPDFQFDADYQVHPAMPSLLVALANIPSMSSADDKGGWRRAFWLYGSSLLLSERALGTGDSESPRSASEVFRIHPETVIALADREAARDANLAW
jgi:hypothetical protein